MRTSVERRVVCLAVRQRSRKVLRPGPECLSKTKCCYIYGDPRRPRNIHSTNQIVAPTHFPSDQSNGSTHAFSIQPIDDCPYGFFPSLGVVLASSGFPSNQSNSGTNAFSIRPIDDCPLWIFPLMGVVWISSGFLVCEPAWALVEKIHISFPLFQQSIRRLNLI